MQHEMTTTIPLISHLGFTPRNHTLESHSLQLLGQCCFRRSSCWNARSICKQMKAASALFARAVECCCWCGCHVKPVVHDVLHPYRWLMQTMLISSGGSGWHSASWWPPSCCKCRYVNAHACEQLRGACVCVCVCVCVNYMILVCMHDLECS
jgi:hypothetical protein